MQVEICSGGTLLFCNSLRDVMMKGENFPK